MNLTGIGRAELIARLEGLLAALPRCSSCGGRAVLLNPDRWPMCEACWAERPCAREPVYHDMREAIAAAER